ncbi:MAG: hypothetical protein ACLUKE_17570 [Blautia wexlerae]
MLYYYQQHSFTSSTTTVFAKDITVTIPNYASDEGNSNLPEAAETVTNSDGSTSYTLDKKQQKKWKKYLKSSFDRFYQRNFR